jgi:hypothetical protein
MVVRICLAKPAGAARASPLSRWKRRRTLRPRRTVLAARSRARVLPTTTPFQIDSPPANKGRRSAERRMPTIAALRRQTLPMLGRGAARHFRRRGRLPALRRGSRRDCHIPAQLQAMLPGTRSQWALPVVSPFQCSGSTPRLGRSTEGNDAQSRSGAGREPARKHRTRSTFRFAPGTRPLHERDSRRCNR